MINYVNFKCGDNWLRGTVHIPESKGKSKFPTVIMFHGFGANRIEYFSSFVNMSRLLEKNNIASVRFDFSGHGESDGDFFDVTISNEVNEGKQIIDFVKTLEFVDPNNINLMGMSLGSVVASIVSAEKSEDVQSLCMWSPAAVVVDEIKINKTLQGKPYAKEIEQKGYFDFNTLKVSQKLIDDAINLNIYDKAEKFDKDVLIIHGDKDWIAPVKYSETYIEHYGKTAKLEVISGADHSWGTVDQREQLFNKTLNFFLK